ncbi:MAG: chromosomal replication initiator DnaA [Hyphomicrobiales bacterium]|nr:MAG: chromosomal replication initiator DnaA [Hyphomicrobiales bacterium]
MTQAFLETSFFPPPPIGGLSTAAAAAAAGLPAAALADPWRRRAHVARARHLAVYLHHVALGASLSACARDFAGDRASMRYACARIEDLRDDPAFDRGAARLEQALAAQRDMVLSLVSAQEGAGQ